MALGDRQVCLLPLPQRPFVTVVRIIARFIVKRDIEMKNKEDAIFEQRAYLGVRDLRKNRT